MGYNRGAFNMLSVTEARERILSHFQTTATESIPLIACASRVLAIDIAADARSPPFRQFSHGWICHPLGRYLRFTRDLESGCRYSSRFHAESDSQGRRSRAYYDGRTITRGRKCRHPVEDTDFHNRAGRHICSGKISFEKTDSREKTSVRAEWTFKLVKLF
jgi:hypothetical protein